MKVIAQSSEAKHLVTLEFKDADLDRIGEWLRLRDGSSTAVDVLSEIMEACGATPGYEPPRIEEAADQNAAAAEFASASVETLDLTSVIAQPAVYISINVGGPATVALGTEPDAD